MWFSTSSLRFLTNIIRGFVHTRYLPIVVHAFATYIAHLNNAHQQFNNQRTYWY